VLTALDSLFNTKDKLRLRLYETSSKYLQNLTRFSKISYDISHSEYKTESGNESWNYGRMSTVEMTVAPIQAVSLTGNLLYRSGIELDSMPSSVIRPGIEIQTIDAPRGVDITASYYLLHNRYYKNNTSTDSVTRALFFILKPGQWFGPLRWFSPRASVSQNVNCFFNAARPSLLDVATALNGVQSSTVNGGFGVHIFPSDAVLLRNFNEWTRADTSRAFSTENDIQVWLGAKNFWQAIWNYYSEKEYHDGSLGYDRIVTPWLRVQPKLNASYITDSLGTKFEGGPALTMNLNFQNVKIIRSLFNSHDLKLVWTRRNGVTNSTPQIGYTFNLSLIILPNLQISNFETLIFDKRNFTDFQSRVKIIVNF